MGPVELLHLTRTAHIQTSYMREIKIIYCTSLCELNFLFLAAECIPNGYNLFAHLHHQIISSWFILNSLMESFKYLCPCIYFFLPQPLVETLNKC